MRLADPRSELVPVEPGPAATVLPPQPAPVPTTIDLLPKKKAKVSRIELDLEGLLAAESVGDKAAKKEGAGISAFLVAKSALELSVQMDLQSECVAAFEYCKFRTKEACAAHSLKTRGVLEACAEVHFIKIVTRYTDESLGECTFLSGCRRKVMYPEHRNPHVFCVSRGRDFFDPHEVVFLEAHLPVHSLVSRPC